ncbi:MAG: hypothetical protein LC723_13470 [Actinobacteria bacterium]|nr:hypothetical protein [Actinomycetota bacterium]
MAHGGDYTFWSSHYQNKHTDLKVTNDATFPTAITVKSPQHRIVVQKITLSLTEHELNATVTFTDDDAAAAVPAPYAIALHNDTNEVAVLVWDFGPKGYGLNVGSNLSVVVDGLLAGVIHIEAYEVLAEPMAVGPNN